jgi:hypothetical protein
MTKRFASLSSTVVLALGIAAFTGSALAGNGNGNGNAYGNAAAQAAPAAQPASQGSPPASPGNSASAPGQAKKDSASTQATGGGSADQNSASVRGIKPTNSTSKSTKCSTGGGAGSSATCTPTTPNATAATAGAGDASKRYGNGKTAAQISNSRGAPAGTSVYGPGNSQPHKVQKCPGSKKWVDVHAVKSYSARSCASQGGVSSSTHGNVNAPKTSSKPTVAGTAAVGTRGSAGSAGATAPTSSPQGGATAPTSSPQGGVLGASESAESGSAGGVLGAIESVGQGVLPFTGFPLWVAVALALALILLGLALRRYGRATA